MIISSLFKIKQVLAGPVPGTDEVIGNVKPNIGILTTDAISKTGELTGIMTLLNSILKLAFIFAGLWAFINFIVAGYGFLSAGGDAKAVGKAWDRIWQSFVGLLVIVASFLLAAIAGMLLFGDATAILNPKLPTP